MKNIIAIASILFFTGSLNAQFLKGLGKRISDVTERTISRKIEEKADKKTEQVMDTVLNQDKKLSLKKRRRKRKNKEEQKAEQTVSTETENKGVEHTKGGAKKTEYTPEILRKSGFLSGKTIVFEDDFNQDEIGDFPVNWETNGSGEIVVIEEKKHLKMSDQALYVPVINEPLPHNYTVEFDLYAPKLDGQTSSLSWFKIFIDDNNSFNIGQNYAEIGLNFCQYLIPYTTVKRVEKGESIINNNLKKDYRENIKGKSKVSIMVNKTRIRLWLDNEKLVDIPKLVPRNKTGYFKILISNAEKEGIYLSNFKIAKTGVDKRSKLISEGKVSYNDILFESGSDKLKPTSFKSIKEIADAMKKHPTVKVKIIGHTDSDGSTESNKTLSQKRALAVKNTLVYKYNIASDRMKTEGKGELEPVASNNTEEGKLKNRRVEFIKL